MSGHPFAEEKEGKLSVRKGVPSLHWQAGGVGAGVGAGVGDGVGGAQQTRPVEFRILNCCEVLKVNTNAQGNSDSVLFKGFAIWPEISHPASGALIKLFGFAQVHCGNGVPQHATSLRV